MRIPQRKLGTYLLNFFEHSQFVHSANYFLNQTKILKDDQFLIVFGVSVTILDTKSKDNQWSHFDIIEEIMCRYHISK